MRVRSGKKKTPGPPPRDRALADVRVPKRRRAPEKLPPTRICYTREIRTHFIICCVKTSHRRGHRITTRSPRFGPRTDGLCVPPVQPWGCSPGPLDQGSVNSVERPEVHRSLREGLPARFPPSQLPTALASSPLLRTTQSGLDHRLVPMALWRRTKTSGTWSGSGTI
jgi:hypothetical protein